MTDGGGLVPAQDDDDEAGDPLGDLLGGMGGDLLAGMGGMGLPDLGSLADGLAKVQAIQESDYEGSAGGGLVTIRANGRMEVASVEIRPGALGDGEPDVELLADLVHAALQDLTSQIAAAQQEAMGPLGGLL